MKPLPISSPSSLALLASAWMLGAGVSSAVVESTRLADSMAPVEPQRQMIAVLGASGPHPTLGAEAALFDRFVGTWDCDFVAFGADGSVKRFAGEVLFGWVLDGRALQDIWIGYPTNGAGAERSIGTSVRIFDAKARTWRVVWVAASYGYLIQLEGGAEGERIVLRGRDTDGAALRWSFNDIRADSFVWRGEKSSDGGASWQLQEEHHMRRRASAAGDRPR